MRTYSFLYEPQIAALIAAYRKPLEYNETGPEGTVGEYAAKLSALSFDELLDRLLTACPDNYAAAAFDCMPGEQVIQRLMGLASGHLRADTHWPLLGVFFGSLRFRSRHDTVDFEAAGEAFITAFNQRLTEAQKEHVVEQITGMIDFNDAAQGKTENRWFNERFTHIGEYYSPWMLNVLGSTVGTVSKLVFTHRFNLASKTNQMLGSQPMIGVEFTLDFRDNPWKYWDPTPNNIVDRLGTCFYAGPDSPHIILFMRPIARAAEDLGCPEQAYKLGMIVFLHEFAHALHLKLKDLDGIRNPAAPHPWSRHDWVELVAQLFTWNTIKDDPQLADLFEKLTDISPPEYQTWRTMRDCSVEDFRAYLWFLRRNGAAKNGLDFQDWFCAEYQQLPPIPKPPTRENVVADSNNAIDE